MPLYVKVYGPSFPTGTEEPQEINYPVVGESWSVELVGYPPGSLVSMMATDFVPNNWRRVVLGTVPASGVWRDTGRFEASDVGDHCRRYEIDATMPDGRVLKGHDVGEWCPSVCGEAEAESRTGLDRDWNSVLDFLTDPNPVQDFGRYAYGEMAAARVARKFGVSVPRGVFTGQDGREFVVFTQPDGAWLTVFMDQPIRWFPIRNPGQAAMEYIYRKYTGKKWPGWNTVDRTPSSAPQTPLIP